MQFKWNYERPTPDRQQQAKELADKIGMSPVLAELLIQRGIKTESAAKRFFRPMLNKERIMVYGDYDVDGCTAVALVYKFLQQFYSNTDYYIPNREEEGYGVSRKGIEYAAETGVKLIVVLDCGIKAVDEIAYAKTLGIDFIICDHHVPDEVMPPAVAILNPKRTDSTYPFKHLCGCGVGFKFMQAFAKNNGIPFSRLIPLLDFCAVSIAADLVPVEGENRTLAFHGLKQLNQSPCIGLKAIIEICGLGGRELTMSDIVFKIGPRINASGRMMNGREAVDLLTERDLQKARRQADDRRGQRDCGTSGESAPHGVDSTLRRRMEERRGGHRRLATDRTILPSDGGADHHRRHRVGIGTLGGRIRHLRRCQVVSRPAGELRWSYLCRGADAASGEYS